MPSVASPPEGYMTVGEKGDQIFVPEVRDNKHERLGVSAEARIAAIGMSTLAAGTVLGIMGEYSRAAMRFRAENAHRLPRSERNWFFYHRAKSYYAMAQALPHGLKLGFRMAPVAMGFVLMEESIDHARGGSSKDLLSTATAGISIAGLYSIITRQRIPEAGRMVKAGLIIGLTYGSIEDAVSFLTGQRLFYVEHLKRAFGHEPPRDVTDAI